MMTSLERIIRTIQRKPVDRLPVYPIVSGVTRHLVNASYYDWATDAHICANALIKAHQFLGTDCICTLTDLSVEASDFGQTIIFPKNEAAYPDFTQPLVASIDDYDRIQKIDIKKASRMQEHIRCCQLLMKEVGKEVPIIAFVFGPLGILSMLRGQSNLYMDLYDCPERIKQAVAVITDVLIDYCQELIKTGVHAIMLDTLFASQSIMSKSMWLEFEGVFVQKLSQMIHDQQCMVMIHNCGTGIYFDAQIEMMHPEAISFLHVADDCSSFTEMKAKYGHQTTFIGAISPSLLIDITDEVLYNECMQQIDYFANDGGFILATGCEYPANLSLDRAKKICDIAHQYRLTTPYDK